MVHVKCWRRLIIRSYQSLWLCQIQGFDLKTLCRGHEMLPTSASMSCIEKFSNPSSYIFFLLLKYHNAFKLFKGLDVFPSILLTVLSQICNHHPNPLYNLLQSQISNHKHLIPSTKMGFTWYSGPASSFPGMDTWKDFATIFNANKAEMLQTHSVPFIYLCPGLSTHPA
jgi:hypothetical protein